MIELIPRVTRCDCGAGAHIITCIKEAIVLSMNVGHSVEFEHNGRIYTVDPKKLVTQVEATLRKEGK